MSSTDTATLLARLEAEFGRACNRALLVRAPGRTEIAGNHTDHEGGSVIAGAVTRHVTGVFSPNGSMVARVMSEGYGLVTVDLSTLDAQGTERGTTAALVRGVARAFADRGYAVSGFDAYLTSAVPVGSGLSSSAAFEVAIAKAADGLWADDSLDASELAFIAKFAENEFFGKPCGLMDQAASALGGVQHMCFADPTKLAAESLDVDFGSLGYAICITAVGQDHSAKTDDYAAVPAEMQAVAALLGKGRLGELAEKDLLSNISLVRESLGDRACLRALHFWREERLVSERREALASRDLTRFLELTRLSGASSAMYLQNVSCGVREQPSMLGIALSEEFLGGRGAARVHGGGFGGTIQAFVPQDLADEYVALMCGVFGDGSCDVYQIDHEGAHSEWL